MTILGLRAVDPNRLRIVHLHDKIHRPRSRAQGLEAGEDPAAGEWVAWVGETALDDRVAPGIETECERVANIGRDDGRVEDEGAVADGDGDVGGEGKG